MSQREKTLLNRIELLRKELNKKINTNEKNPELTPQTLALSRQLDNLINQYMHTNRHT